MRPDQRDAAYVWDMLQAVQEIEDMIGDVSALADARGLIVADLEP